MKILWKVSALGRQKGQLETVGKTIQLGRRELEAEAAVANLVKAEAVEPAETASKRGSRKD